MEVLFNVAGAAKYLICSPQAVRQWIKQGKLECYRAGTRIRITQRQMNKFLQRNDAGEDEGNDFIAMN